MKSLLVAVAIMSVHVIAAPERVFAQTPLPGKLEAGIGGMLAGPAGLGTTNATETTPAGTPSTLFSSSSTVAATPAVEGHIGLRILRRVDVEGFGSFGKTMLRSSVANDVEGATPVVATEDVTQYTAGMRVVWYPSRNTIRFAPTGRVRLFIAGGAAYLRELHQTSTLASTGQAYQVDVGIKRMLTARSKHHQGFGIGGEVGVLGRTQGVAFDNRTRFSPRAAVSLFSRF